MGEIFTESSVWEFLKPRLDSNFTPLRSIRLKITDRCHWNCWWCHNEGTGERNPKITKDIEFKGEFADEFLNLCEKLNINEIHITGGEPSTYKGLVESIKFLKKHGFIVKMTSIGNTKEIMDEIFNAGIDGINFSLHAIETEELHSTQVDRTLKWTKVQQDRQFQSILSAKKAGIKVKLNTVMASQKDIPRIKQVIDWAFENDIDMRILPEINFLEKSVNTIRNFLNFYGAVEKRRQYTLGVSSGTIFYDIPGKKEIGFKILMPSYLDSMCNSCDMKKNGTCREYFYGIRFENKLGMHNVRLCVHKTNSDTYMRMDEFLDSEQFKEIKNTQEDYKM
ncbi:radical SAM protein [Bacillus sp. DX4.1]|uniref:radical SAM protein n=1 Tax=Bacillus sp. DX4.1 TaxID=3055867 RepID=UPI0025A0D80F|nr:radical SAM protein [Bacillus sp. DX4.1]MDM5185978.1 radical SAM protein [Bacillus sp. DX4.1]